MNKEENRSYYLSFLGKEISKRRRLAKISQKALAAALEMTTAQLCKIEKGRNLTGPEILLKIEQLLGMNAFSLVELRNQIADQLNGMGGVEYPTLFERIVPACDQHSIPTEDLEHLVESIVPTLDEYVKAEDTLGLIHFCRLNLGMFDAANEDDGIVLADAVRFCLGVGDAPLRDLLPLLEQQNIRIVFVNDLPLIHEGNGRTKVRVAFSFYDRQYDVPVICVSRNAPPEEQLYNIAYELASCLRFRKALRTNRHPSNPEWAFCRAFASSILMPTTAIRDVADTLRVGDDQWTITLLDDIALRFGVSIRALVWRLQSLGRISELLFETLKGPGTKKGGDYVDRLTMPRPPLVEGLWLRALKERTCLAV